MLFILTWKITFHNVQLFQSIERNLPADFIFLPKDQIFSCDRGSLNKAISELIVRAIESYLQGVKSMYSFHWASV